MRFNLSLVSFILASVAVANAIPTEPNHYGYGSGSGEPASTTDVTGSGGVQPSGATQPIPISSVIETVVHPSGTNPTCAPVTSTVTVTPIVEPITKTITIASTVAPVTTTVTVTPAPKPSWKSRGCYSDSAARIITGAGMSQKGMTVEICTNTCLQKGFHFAALEYRQECYCGTNINSANGGKVAEGECNMACDGNPAEQCGGFYRANVYEFA